VSRVIHATTLFTNALIERRGASSNTTSTTCSLRSQRPSFRASFASRSPSARGPVVWSIFR
jgi:hypothetical protein